MKKIVSFFSVSLILCSLFFSCVLNAQCNPPPPPGCPAQWYCNKYICPDCDGNIIFTSQAQIDGFATICGGQNLRNVGVLQASDVTNLDGLSGITSVSGDLAIDYNPLLTSISGLSALTTIGGNFQITNNPALTTIEGINALKTINGNYFVITTNNALTTISGFNALTVIPYTEIDHNNALTTISGFNALTSISSTATGSLLISANPALTTISGFDALKTFENEFYIGNNNSLISITGFNTLTSFMSSFRLEHNPALTTISGFGALTNVGNLFSIDHSAFTNFPNFNALTTIGSLEITNNPSLIDLNGLSALKSIGGYAVLGYNAKLADLNGLSALQSINGDFSIYYSNLTSLNGLSALTTVNGKLSISANNVLTSLTGINNITPSSLTGLNIGGNNLLSACAVKSTCGYLQITPSKPFTIQYNSSGCYTVNEILASCSALPVELISFSGKKVAGYNVLDWRTATEINNSGFDVERGNGVSAFEKIGFVPGAGNSSVMLSYSFTDKNPLSGVNYYRLKQINNDGKFTYSNIIDVENPDTGSFGIFPNPGSDKIYVQGMSENTAYSITNIQGQILQSGVLLHNQTVNVSALPQGLYFLRTPTQTAKFVKQNSY